MKCPLVRLIWLFKKNIYIYVLVECFGWKAKSSDVASATAYGRAEQAEARAACTPGKRERERQSMPFSLLMAGNLM